MYYFICLKDEALQLHMTENFLQMLKMPMLQRLEDIKFKCNSQASSLEWSFKSSKLGSSFFFDNKCKISLIYSAWISDTKMELHGLIYWYFIYTVTGLTVLTTSLTTLF